MKYLLGFLVCMSMASFAFGQRDTIALNVDWRFVIDKTGEGMGQQWFSKELAGSKEVQLPHTWNIEPNNQNHYGWGWYQKKIAVPAQWKSKNVVLQFGAVNHTSYVYVNGVQVTENIGDGFNKFFVNLTGLLAYGKDNIITVAVNNDYGRNKVPFGSSFDWPNDGGIIRPVAMIVSNKPAANYVHITPRLNLVNNEGELQVTLGFDKQGKKSLKLAVTITEENQPTHHVVLTKTSTPVWQDAEATVNFVLPTVNPWHFDFPNLYRVDVVVIDGNKAVDRLSANIGFRQIKFINGQTFLNGERVKLMGVEWTAGSNPDYGFAETDSIIISQGKLMKDVNAIFTRQHFQQSDVFYDFCDRNGIIVQQEVPLWGPETPANDTIQRIAMSQLQRMIGNNYNYTSIFAWGVGNELRGRSADIKKMITALIARARSLDSSRMVAYVSNTLTQNFYNDPHFSPDAANDGDFIMMNEYGGSWWAIPTGKIHNYLDSVHMSYPDKPFFISEFGLCAPNFRGGDERRLQDLIYHMAIYETKPYVEGAIYFDLTDYRTHYPGTLENDKFRRRIHGVYDMYGKPKPSMKVLREMSSPVEVQQMIRKGKDKSGVLIFGNIGLPQHAVSGYKLYLSDKLDNYLDSKAYNIPVLQPGQRVTIDVDDPFDAKGILTVVRPNGYVVSQKSFAE